MTYQQSTSVEEVRAKHPFPWREQRAGAFVRVVDAEGKEVVIFELTALAVIISHLFAAKDKSAVNDAK